jgi:superfamily II DNA or RNA helicase
MEANKFIEDLESEEDFWKKALSYEFKEEKTTTKNEADEITNELINISSLPKEENSSFNKKIYINRNGIYIDVSNVENVDVRHLSNKFMIKTKSAFGGKWNIARGFNIVRRNPQTFLIVPRFGFLQYYFETINKDMNKTRKNDYADMILLKKLKLCNLSNIVNQLPIFDKSPQITAEGLQIKDHQKVIIKYIMDNYYNDVNLKYGFAGINLKLKTGAGKSYIAMGLINELKVPTLIVVHNQPQAEDMYELAKKYFPNVSVGIYHSAMKKLGDIMIIVIHSAYGSDDYVFPTGRLTIQQFYSRFGFGIFDESHKYCSSKFSQVFSRCQLPYMLGLSATPGERQDDFDPLTYWNVGGLVDIKERIPGILEDDPFITKIACVKYSGSPEYTAHKVNEYGMFDYDGMLTQIMEDPHRKLVVIDILKFLYDNGRNVYIFSDRLEYISDIRRDFYLELHKSGEKADMIDESAMEYMKTLPTYEKYKKALEAQISNRFSVEIKKIHLDVEQKIETSEKANGKIIALHQKYSAALELESSKEYFEDLQEMYKKNFIDEFIEQNSTLSLLTGGASGEQIAASSERATMIFTTYGYMGTGKSIPKMDTILLLTPRRNGVEQVLGRIFRPGPNDSIRWIIDIIDWKINLKSQFYERQVVYEKQKEQNRSPTIYNTDIKFESPMIYNDLEKIFITSEGALLKRGRKKKAATEKKIKIIKSF